MTRTINLSPRAKFRLHEIADWTRQNFGSRQAARYGAGLVSAIEAVAAGKTEGRNCLAVFGDNSPSGLFFVSATSHLIFYTLSDTEIVVTDILHQSMDIPGHLRN